MPSSEFNEWVAVDQIDPFGEFRDDYRTATIAMTIAQVFAGKNKRWRIKDFMPQFDKESVVVDDAALEAKSKAWVISVGGIINDG